jgi:hypothetical protein
LTLLWHSVHMKIFLFVNTSQRWSIQLYTFRLLVSWKKNSWCPVRGKWNRSECVNCDDDEDDLDSCHGWYRNCHDLSDVLIMEFCFVVVFVPAQRFSQQHEKADQMLRELLVFSWGSGIIEDSGQISGQVARSMMYDRKETPAAATPDSSVFNISAVYSVACFRWQFRIRKYEFVLKISCRLLVNWEADIWRLGCWPLGNGRVHSNTFHVAFLLCKDLAQGKFSFCSWPVSLI